MADLIVQEEGTRFADEPMEKLLSYSFGISIIMASLLSCTDRSMSVMDAQGEEICVLQTVGSCGILGRLNSIAVVDSSCFVICDESQVYLYDITGRQVRRIGRSGKAGHEYIMPQVVRSDGESIYVWSAMTMKFLQYDVRGNLLGEYGYASALRDFVPAGDNLVIYASGIMNQSIVNIYDKSDGSVRKCLYPASPEHKTISAWLSTAPLLYEGKDVYAVPQDRMDLLHIDESGETDLLSSVHSETFKVSEYKLTEGGSREKEIEYLYSNPYTVALLKKGECFYLLASEGKYDDRAGRIDDSHRYYAIYRFNKKGGEKCAVFSMESIGYSNLVSQYADDIYYICHDVEDDNDIYTLKRMRL